MKIDFSQFQNLDPENIGNWPFLVKGTIFVAAVVAVAAAGYHFIISDLEKVLAREKLNEVTLRNDFETKQTKAVLLGAYKQQMQEMEESFGSMLRQLPSKTEIPELIVDITQTGLANGLKFDLFQPGSEATKDFYSEKPISLQVSGNYHNIAEFVSGIAILPRIVTLHDVQLAIASDQLTMRAQAKTYRYLEQ
ncbi:MAG: type 4a pilus biogenesis protein PilO [Gammaproteobacteria bacterium]|nr:type 4a pilus biogenesis protein PilO [Gammaproteobacteria bacterium]